MADDTGAGTNGNGNENNTPENNGGQNNGAGNGGDGGTRKGGGESGNRGGGTSAYTQEDVDRIVSDRLARERKKYSDYDELKATAEKNKTAAQEKQTVEQQLDQLRKDMADRDAAATAEKAEVAGDRLHSRLVRGGLSDEDAQTLVDSIDPFRLLDEGKPDAKEIDRLAKSLLKIGTRQAPDRDQGRKGGDAPPSMNQLIRDAARRNRVM